MNSVASISKASGSGLSTLCAPMTTLAERAPSAQCAAVKTQSFEINDALKDIGRKDMLENVPQGFFA